MFAHLLLDMLPICPDEHSGSIPRPCTRKKALSESVRSWSPHQHCLRTAV